VVGSDDWAGVESRHAPGANRDLADSQPDRTERVVGPRSRLPTTWRARRPGRRAIGFDGGGGSRVLLVIVVMNIDTMCSIAPARILRQTESMLLPVKDPHGAQWVVDRWSDTFQGQLVPSGFAACARLFHPAMLGGRPVAWTVISAANGTTAHPRMDFLSIVGGEAHLRGQPRVFDREPESGWVPRDLVPRVAAVLRRHTSVDRCWFGIWEDTGTSPGRSGQLRASLCPDGATTSSRAPWTMRRD